MIHDIEFLQSRMAKLEGSAELSQYLHTIVNGKSVAQQAEENQEQIGSKDPPEVTILAEGTSDGVPSDKT